MTELSIVVRESGPEDVRWVDDAGALIDQAADRYDIARRDREFLEGKISTGRAALAFDDGKLIGFGYYSEWEEGRFVSHSGLVVDDDYRGLGLGRKLKMALFDASRRRLPQATMMSLTTSPQVKKMNISLGFRVVPLDQLTKDPAFWRGCEACRNYASVQAAGEKCCCEGMILPPDEG